MHPYIASITHAALLRRLSLPLAIAAFSACADDSHAPTAPIATAPTLSRGGNGDNNGRIVFQSNVDEPFGSEIYSMNPDGTGISRLTRSPGGDRNPARSPDGKKIVFESTRDDPSGEIYVMNADGTGTSRLTYSAAFDRRPVWSKDGKRIAFESTRDDANPLTDDDTDIYVMNADGTQVSRLTYGPSFDKHASWSPDGKQIAFVSDRDNAPELLDVYLVNVEDRQVSRVTYLASGEVIFPSWSPGGKQIAFSTDQVFVVNTDGTQLAQLTYGGTFNIQPSWSADAKQIVFTGAGNGGSDIFKMNADGSGRSQLTYSFGEEASPSWRR
jgi:TolB protein